MEAEAKDTSTNTSTVVDQIGTFSPPSRKREREISQEPATPATPTVDLACIVEGEEPSNGSAEPVGVTPRSKKRSPKKNRVGTCELGVTREEETEEGERVEEAGHEDQDEGENQMVISVSGSPPHETKMRQISEGVGEMKMMKKDGSSVTATANQGEEDDVFVDAVEELAGQTGPESSREAVAGGLMWPCLIVDDLPSSSAKDSTSDEAAAVAEPSPSASSTSSVRRLSSRRGSQSEDMDQDKMLKRKLGDRAVSESRESESGGKKASRKGVSDIAPMTSMGGKRSREGSDKDTNPRESKRPSPPPEKKPGSTSNGDIQPEASSSKPKLSGFMAYAGSGSPFSSAKGSNLFKSSESSTTAATNESIKRPRDDADKDDNPRETKRPSPPPEQRTAEEPQQQENGAPNSPGGGFLAFASTSSPFAKVKGPNLFVSSNKSSNASPSWSRGPTSPFSPSSLHQPAPTPAKRGFEAFGSASTSFTGVVRSKSPVGALGRSKSPPPRKAVAKSSSAFSAYATSGVQGFSMRSAAGKRARADDVADDGKRKRNSIDSSTGGAGTRSDEGSEGSEEREKMSFGERLRAEKDDQGSGVSDDDGKVVLTEQELHTGEEDEETIYQVRGKLFALSEQNQWREKGTGIIKLNLRKSDGGGARLVMRKDAVFTVILNATLFRGMNCSYAPQDQRYLRFSTVENGTTTHYNLRLANPKIAGGLLEEVNAHIPSN